MTLKDRLTDSRTRRRLTTRKIRKPTRFSRQTMSRRFITVFSGVMTVLYLLRSVAAWILVSMGDPDMDTRLAILGSGLFVLYLTAALLSHFDQPAGVVLTVVGLVLTTTCGFDFIQGNMASAVMELFLAVGMLAACVARKRLGMQDDEL